MTRPFRINRRMARGWDSLREKWTHANNQEEDQLRTILANEQARLVGKFGDPHLFMWLARPENHTVWAGSKDLLTLFAHYNAMLALTERSRETALMTLPDPLMHPRSVQWEAEGGSNLKNYKISNSGGDLWVVLPLLSKSDDNRLKDIEHTFLVAPSGQFSQPVFQQQGKNIHTTYRSSSGELFTGIIGAADLLLDWSWLRNKPLSQIKNGHIGPAFLKVSIDTDAKLPDGWTGKRPKMVNHFLSARGSVKHSQEVVPGLRVLSVDLGMRSFAACSVFTLTESLPDPNKFALPIGIDGLCALHERSFLLTLPGENPDHKVLEWRRQQGRELRSLRKGLNRYRRLYPLDALSDPKERKLYFESLLSEEAGTTICSHEQEIFDAFTDSYTCSSEEWLNSCEDLRTQYRHYLGRQIGEWRRDTRNRSFRGASGKTLWSIDYLTNVRKLLVSWSLSGQRSGQINRLDRAKRGIFASELLDHIQGLKDDRLKTGADLLVQASRGYLRNREGCWEKRYVPCHIVLFEDLSRYRMKTDRPRRENSSLMLWSHRAIPNEVAMQGEIYGLNTCDTSADFSSRYHARTQAPGVRCHALTLGDINDPVFMNILATENPGLDPVKLKVGDLVPLRGGEWFASLKQCRVNTIHADINAAQNLQRRFWTRHADAFRIPCRKHVINDEERWVPKSMGKRLRGSLGSYGWLVPTGHDSGSCRWETITPGRYKSLGGEVQDDDSIDVDALEDNTDDVLEATGQIVVFFRDPSGEVMPADFWYPAKSFWGMVKAKTVKALKGKNSRD